MVRMVGNWSFGDLPQKCVLVCQNQKETLWLLPIALGGHAYSAYNAIAGLIADFGVVTTGGGDNYVLTQQCARYLINSLQRVKSGKEVGETVKYFLDVDAILATKSVSPSSPADLLKLQWQLKALTWLSIASVAAVRSVPGTFSFIKC